MITFLKNLSIAIGITILFILLTGERVHACERPADWGTIDPWPYNPVKT